MWTVPVMKRARASGPACTTRPLLEGVKVLDLGAFYAGPFSSRLLADLGAEVIKLEAVAGDPMRGRDMVFNSAQAGKRAICVDLKTAEGAQIGAQLARWADIIHHNMRPGAAERIGFGYRDIAAKNPDVIYLHAPGWGSAGPFSDRQSFAPLLSGYVGIGFEVAGQFNEPLFPAGNEDSGNGLLGAVGMLLGLLVREQGKGPQFVENPQLNAALAHVSHHVRHQNGEVLGVVELDPLQFGTGALERLYETADGWICVVADTEMQVQALLAALDLDLLEDHRFSSEAARAKNDYALSEILAGIFVSKPTADWIRVLSAKQVPVAEPVTDNNERFMLDSDNVDSRRVRRGELSAFGRY